MGNLQSVIFRGITNNCHLQSLGTQITCIAKGETLGELMVKCKEEEDYLWLMVVAKGQQERDSFLPRMSVYQQIKKNQGDYVILVQEAHFAYS